MRIGPLGVAPEPGTVGERAPVDLAVPLRQDGWMARLMQQPFQILFF